MAEESCKEAALLGLQLEQVGSELQLLLGSEARLEGLVDTLRDEARHREAHVKTLKGQLHRYNWECFTLYFILVVFTV